MMMTGGKHRIAWAITLMAVAVCGSDTTHSAIVTPSQSTAGSVIRHEDVQNTPPEYDLRAIGTYNGKIMPLMKSPCRPELSGYFGATSGLPIRVQFGFKIETLPLAPISQVISAIEDKVADEILSSEFPQICGFSENRRRLSHATGFRFIHYAELPDPTCDPTIGPLNYCGVFEGGIHMYGTAEDVSAEDLLVHINKILKSATPGAIHKTLVSITTVDEFVLVLGPEDDGRDKGLLADSAVFGLPRLLLVGTGLAFLVVIVGIIWFALDRKRRVNLIFSDPAIMYNMTRKNPRNNRGGGSGGIFDFFIPRKEKKRGDFYDPGANSLRHSPETDEAVDFGAGNMLLLTDGRPVEVDFDQNYKSNMAETSEGIV